MYALTDPGQRCKRAAALLKALAVLRGGAKQAQFGTDVAPKAMVLAGLTCGNPVFNQLFADGDGAPTLKIPTLKEILADYSDRIVTPVFLGIRAGYLLNEDEVAKLNGFYEVDPNERAATLKGPSEQAKTERSVEIRIRTPIQAAKEFGESLN